MADLGLPRVRVAFLSAAEQLAQMDTIGIVALILRDATIAEPTAMTFRTLSAAKEAKAWSADNAKAIEMAFAGGPRMVRLAALPSVSDLTAAYDMLETLRFDICCPVGLSAQEMEEYTLWALNAYDSKHKHAIYAMTGEAGPDSPYLIWFDTDDIVTANGTYSASQFLPRIAGAIAGLPIYQAPTYHVLTDVLDCPHLKRVQADAAIAAGKMILYYDGEKVKIARGVNSLVTVPGTEGYTDEWKKVKVIRILNRIEDDVITVTEDNYIGKMPNTYINKLLLIADINAYLTELEGSSVLYPGANSVDINTEAQRKFLKTIMDPAVVDEMDEQAVREADTRDKVFLRGRIRPIDSIEDVYVDFVL